MLTAICKNLDFVSQRRGYAFGMQDMPADANAGQEPHVFAGEDAVLHLGCSKLSGFGRGSFQGPPCRAAPAVGRTVGLGDDRRAQGGASGIQAG